MSHVPAGQARQTMLYGCYACFGMSLVTALIIITLIWSRLAHFGSSGSARVPTLWIVLGPVGQSITAAGALGTAALTAVAPPLSTGFNVFAVVFGVPMGLHAAVDVPGVVADRAGPSALHGLLHSPGGRSPFRSAPV